MSIKITVVNKYHLGDVYNSSDLVYIGRGDKDFPASPLGNPFRIGQDFSREEAVVAHRQWFFDKAKHKNFNDAEKAALRQIYLKAISPTGVRLCCYCASKPESGKVTACHGDNIKSYLEYIYSVHGENI